MELETKYFSTLQYEEDEVIFFPEGLFGFESYQRFILIRFENQNTSLICLQSVDEANIAFVMINPYHFLPKYEVALPEDEGNPEESAVYTICVLQESVPESTANLRCPIVINTKTRLAKQIILENTEYPFKYPFKDLIPKEG